MKMVEGRPSDQRLLCRLILKGNYIWGPGGTRAIPRRRDIRGAWRRPRQRAPAVRQWPARWRLRDVVLAGPGVTQGTVTRASTPYGGSSHLRNLGDQLAVEEGGIALFAPFVANPKSTSPQRSAVAALSSNPKLLWLSARRSKVQTLTVGSKAAPQMRGTPVGARPARGRVGARPSSVPVRPSSVPVPPLQASFESETASSHSWDFSKVPVFAADRQKPAACRSRSWVCRIASPSKCWQRPDIPASAAYR